MTESIKVKYYSLIPTEFKLDGGAMFGIIPKPLWEKKIPSDDENRINMALRVLVIRTDNKTIIIDSGVGDYHPESFKKRHGVNSTSSPLAQLLKINLNISPEEVTDIIPSHLHFDHVGGFTSTDLKTNEIIPVFPNAKIHLHKEHHKYAMKPNKRDAGSFQKKFFAPLIEYYQQNQQINWLEGLSGQILKDETSNYKLNFKCSHGHTPFHIHPLDSKMIFMGDLVPTSAHINPVWVIGYDMQPSICPDERINFYRFIEDKKLTMIYDHDLKYWGSQVSLTKDEKGRSRYIAKEAKEQSPHSFQLILEDQ